jgi:hypothetical protein
MLNARTGATMHQYCQAFERRSLVLGKRGKDKADGAIHARARAYEIVCDLRYSERTVILLGEAVRAAFDHALGGKLPPVLIHPTETGGIIFRQIPHPLVAGAWYNDSENTKLIELLLEELYVRSHGSVEKV